MSLYDISYSIYNSPSPYLYITLSQLGSGFIPVCEMSQNTPTNKVIIIPSELHDEDLLDPSSGEDVLRQTLRRVQPLPPSSLAFRDDMSRRVRTCLDHTIFVYPIAFEKFANRYV